MHVREASVAVVWRQVPVDGSMTGSAPHAAPPAGGGGGPNGLVGGGGGVTPPPAVHVPAWLQKLFVQVIDVPYADGA
jgi:hypothetical protein